MQADAARRPVSPPPHSVRFVAHPCPTCRAQAPCPSRAQVGVPIDAFIKSAMEGLDEGLDEVACTDAGKRFRAVIDDEKFGKMFEMLQQ